MPFLTEMLWRSRHIALNILMLLSLMAGAKDSLRFPVDSISVFRMDINGNVFLADQHGTLYKFTAEGKEVTRVNSKLNGRIQSIDCSNPFEIYVYHREQNTVVLYDNMLNTRSTLALNALGYTNVQAIARSYDNGIWLFDNSSYELRKIDRSGQLLLSSGTISPLIKAEINPIAIVEDQQQVYLADSSAGIFRFDLFGNFSQRLEMGALQDLDVSKGRIYGLRAEGVVYWDPLELHAVLTPLPLPANNICISGKQVYASFRNIIVPVL